MEENSDVHMETDVSSTTDDVVETQEVTGSNGQVEMTITVEKVDEGEATSNMENDTHKETDNNVSIISSGGQESAQKEQSQQSPNNIDEVSKAIPKLPVISESSVKGPTILSLIKTSAQFSSTEQNTESADSSTKTDPTISPSKDNNSKEKTPDKVVTQSTLPALNINNPIKIIKNSPIKEISTENNPVINNEEQKIQTSFQHNKSPTRVEKEPADKSPNKEAEQKRSFQVIQRSPQTIKSPPIKLVRKQAIKELKLHDTKIQEVKLQDSTKLSTNTDETAPKTVLETTNLKQSQKENQTTAPSAVLPLDVMEEASNDSQHSTTTSEKEHKGISREMRSLLNSAKESKIISECTQLTSKTRKSRSNLDTSINTSVEMEIAQDNRRDSQTSEANRQPLKRSMRSQNPEFVTKCKQFLNSVTSRVLKDSDETQTDSDSEDLKVKQKPEPQTEPTDSTETTPKRKKVEETVNNINQSNKLRSDPFCWRCHWQIEAEPNEKPTMHPPMHCTVCVRSYHFKCMSVVERKFAPDKNWVCPDCLQILHAESSETRSPAMKKISLGMLCDLLKYGLERMEALNGVEPFLHPVDRNECPDYDKIVVHPMDLSQMRQNITDGHYGSTEAFIADAQWILHNSILFNTSHSKLTPVARALVRTCRSEMAEIETCPECYAGAHSRNLTYFTDVCSTPHMILWAKLKGFPYWPAKAVAVNNGLVDVRFFGQHDKSWVPVKDCYLYSEKDPNTTKHKKQELMQCRQEAEVHIRNICRKYGTFVYAPFKTSFDHTKMAEQLKLMIPMFEGEIKTGNEKKASPVAQDSRSNSKSSKGSSNDGDASECEDSSTKSVKPVDDSASVNNNEEIILKREPHTSINKTVNKMEVDASQTITEPETPSRKRRRSTLPGPAAVAESSTQKKKKVDEKPEEKPPETTPEKSKEDTVIANTSEAEVAEITQNAEKTATVTTETASEDSDKPISLEEKESLRVTPIKLVALPRANKQTPKIFTTAKVTKSTPGSSTPTTPTTPSTPAEEEKSLNASTSKSSKVSRADKFIIAEKKDVKVRSSRNSRNKSLTTTPKQEKEKSNKVVTPKLEKDKTDKSMDKSIDKTKDKVIDKNKEKSTDKSLDKTKEKSTDKSVDKGTDKSVDKSKDKNKVKNADKKSDSGSDASTSKEKPPNKKKDESDRSLLKKAPETPKLFKNEKETIKKSEDDVSLAIIARSNRNSSSGLPTISNVVSLSTTAEKTTTTATKPTTTNSKATTPNVVEITVDANPNSNIFTPTSTNNVGNMKEAVAKLQKLRSETTSTPVESFVGRVGVKAFARMTSPDINDDVEVKTEPLDLDEIDEERHIEKMDLMNACKLQPVKPTSLRDVRINKVVVTPHVVAKKPGAKVAEPRPRAKKTFPQPRRPEGGSELNGKNSMVYIPIQPPNTQQPTKAKPVSTHLAISMPMHVSAGPRPSAPFVSTHTVNTVTTPLRPITSTISAPTQLVISSTSTVANTNTMTGQMSNINQVPPVGQVSNVTQVPNVGQVPTVGPTTVHTVPLMTSVNGQWMFSLQPMMSVGAVDNTPSKPMVNGINERPTGSLVPISTASSNPTILSPMTPVTNRTQNTNSSPSVNDTGTPEMPRLLQRPLLNPFDANTPIGNLPPPSTAGPLTAKLNQNAVKLTDFFRTLLEDSIEKLDEPMAQVTALKIQLEQARWRHQQNMDELKHNNELTLSEMRQSFEKEKLRIVSEARRAAQVELDAAVKLTKEKQWCSNCHQEAQFYCCWNTSYCDYTCQRAHWNTHFSHCTQEQSYRQILRNQMDLMPDDHPVRESNAITQIGKDGPSSVCTKTVETVERPRDQVNELTMTSMISIAPQSVDLTEQISRELVIRQQSVKILSHKKIMEPTDQRPRNNDQQNATVQILSHAKNMEPTDQRPRNNEQATSQQPLINITSTEVGEQRSRDQQTVQILSHMKSMEPTDQRPRSNDQATSQQPTINKTTTELGEQRSRDQQNVQILSHNKIMSTDQRPRNNDQATPQQMIKPPNLNDMLAVGQPAREQLQFILMNAKQRDEARRQKLDLLRQQQTLRDESRRYYAQQMLREYGKQKVVEQRLSDQPGNSTDKDAPESRLQQGDNPPALQKSAPSQTPALTTIGGKPAPMRVFTDSSGTQKTSIIVSMIEDTTGNQTLKCVGTYKAPAQAGTQISPLLINKQTANDDSGSAKKTVTSGGYLIVGASGNTASVITPATARRPHVQQYFS